MSFLFSLLFSRAIKNFKLDPTAKEFVLKEFVPSPLTSSSSFASSASAVSCLLQLHTPLYRCLCLSFLALFSLLSFIFLSSISPPLSLSRARHPPPTLTLAHIRTLPAAAGPVTPATTVPASDRLPPVTSTPTPHSLLQISTQQVQLLLVTRCPPYPSLLPLLIL